MQEKSILIDIVGCRYADQAVVKAFVDTLSAVDPSLDDTSSDEDIEVENFISFEPEPTNEHDPNAILCLYGGQKVGYVAKKSQEAFKEVVQNTSLVQVSVEELTMEEVNSDVIRYITLKFSTTEEEPTDTED